LSNDEIFRVHEATSPFLSVADISAVKVRSAFAGKSWTLLVLTTINTCRTVVTLQLLLTASQC